MFYCSVFSCICCPNIPTAVVPTIHTTAVVYCKDTAYVLLSRKEHEHQAGRHLFCVNGRRYLGASSGTMGFVITGFLQTF